MREHGHGSQGPVGPVHLPDVLLKDVDVGEGLVANGAGVHHAQGGLGAVHSHVSLEVALRKGTNKRFETAAEKDSLFIQRLLLYKHCWQIDRTSYSKREDLTLLDDFISFHS